MLILKGVRRKHNSCAKVASARAARCLGALWRGDGLLLGDDLVSEKEKAGEDSRSSGADSYEGHDSRRVTISQEKLLWAVRAEESEVKGSQGCSSRQRF